MKYDDKFREKLTRSIQNQSALSRKTGLSQSAISEIVGGRRRGYFDQIVTIAQKLGISLDWLADDKQSDMPVPEYTEDERTLIRVYRAYQFDLDTALNLLRPGMPIKAVGENWTKIDGVKPSKRTKNNGA